VKREEAAASIREALGRETHLFARTAMARASIVASGGFAGFREPVSGVVEYPLLLEDD
jgi:hypothetical protein